MKNFDIDIKTNNISSDIAYYSNSEGDEKDKKNWQETLQKVTDVVASVTDYGANKEGVGFYEQDKKLKGKKVTKLGLDPLVFIVVSVGVLIGTSITILMLKRKN